MTQTTIAVSKLRISSQNVRKIGAKDGLEPLLASIIAHGLLSNLLVTPADAKGIHQVFAGGRRLRAVQLGIKNGTLNKDYQAPVTIIAGDGHAQSEKSLAENIMRSAMSPADECRAYLAFMGDTPDIAAVAERFGQTVRYVEGRLRLAKLAKPIFAALSKGEISLEVAAAYCSTTDQTKQIAVWKDLSGSYSHSFTNVRRAINDGAIGSDHPIARFVGEDAYLGAGGRVERELFMVAETSDWIDGHIAVALATDKMSELAEQTRAEQGLGWVTPRLLAHPDWEAVQNLQQYWPQRVALSATDQERVTQIKARIEELEAIIDNGRPEDPATHFATAECDALEAEHSTIIDKSHEIAADLRPMIGTFLLLDHEGTPKLHHQLYSTAAVKRANKAQGATNASGESAQPSEKLSARLLDELAIQRRDILACHLASDARLALDLTIFQLAYHAAGKGDPDAGCAISISYLGDPSVGERPVSKASEALHELHSTLERDWLGEADTLLSFTRFRALEEDAKAAWLAFAVAKSLKVTRASGCAADFAALLAQTLEIDVAAQWRPTAQNYFDRVPKAATLAVLSEIGGPTLSARFMASKKGDIALAAEKICAGEGFMTPHEKARALRWLPTPMRFATDANELPDTRALAGDQDEVAEQREASGAEGAEGDGESVDLPAEDKPVEDEPAKDEADRVTALHEDA